MNIAKMERFEALRLIEGKLGEVVTYLEGLKVKIGPEFERRDFLNFDVGVDVVETAVNNSIQYTVNVYDRVRDLSASGVLEAVMIAEPKFRGRAGVVSGLLPYPTGSFLGLELLKDMGKARETGMCLGF
jgi:hypothetical protein